MLSGPAAAAPGDISTVAGNGSSGYSGDGGPATSAGMGTPLGAAMSGGDLLVPDWGNHTVRRVAADGTVSTVAGTGSFGYSGDGGPGTSARLASPTDVVADAAGNVYIADFNNHRIRRVTPGGVITTFAGTGSSGYTGDGGPALLARLDGPIGLTIDGAGNIYLADFNNHVIRRITAAGIISTVAGNGSAGSSGDGGPATSARLDGPGDVQIDGAGNLYIPEYNGDRVRKVTAATGTISTVAGTGSSGYSGDGGPATAARLFQPIGVDVDSLGNVFIADLSNHVIRRVNSAGTINTVAGTGTAGYSGDGGAALSARLSSPSRVTLDTGGNFFISDSGNHRVRRVEALGSPAAPTLTATSPASPSSANNPRVQGTAVAGSTVRLYTNATCTSAVAATGTAAQLASPGLTVAVPSDSTTTFWATATDGSGNASGCSTSSVTYVEDSTAPAAPSIGSSPPSPDNDQTPTWSFTGEAGASFECRLTRGATVVSDWSSCTARRACGRTNHWGRISLRFGPDDFKGKTKDGLGDDWPIAYEDVAPYYDRVDRLIGLFGSVEGMRNHPDGIFHPPPKPRCYELLVQKASKKLGIPCVPARLSIIT
ncbi:MAG TPA: hypothetical protein VHG69_02655, partial [Thermoleophilaceae bacterium]|nr:hypothetical protein [Thermoleophilaceae bacterium]